MKVTPNPQLSSFFRKYIFTRGLSSSVGIATDYGLVGPGIEFQWGRDFPPVQTSPGSHPASCTMGTGFFLRVKCSCGVLLTTHPLLALRSWKSRAKHLPPLGHIRASNGVTLPFTYSHNALLLCKPVSFTAGIYGQLQMFTISLCM
jgi:hypothetical protein